MMCPLCKIEMRINATRHVLVDDDTPDKETKLFVEQDLICRNKNCTNFQKVVQTVKTQLQLSKQSQ